MPQLANITVKASDGTTDVTYTGVVPSAGDKIPAVWRDNSVGSAINQRPDIRVDAQSNGPGTTRRVNFSLTYPELQMVDGASQKTNNLFSIIGTATVPTGMRDAQVLEATHRSLNVLASGLFKEMVASGYAAS